jgi:hypothetical protein
VKVVKPLFYRKYRIEGIRRLLDLGLIQQDTARGKEHGETDERFVLLNIGEKMVAVQGFEPRTLRI